MEAIRIGIVDDDQLIVELLQDYLNMQQDLKVVLAATSGQECLDNLQNISAEIDLLLVDLKMAQMNGIELIKHLRDRHPEIKIIVVSSHYQVSSLGFMLKNGTAAFIPKGIAPAVLLSILYEVHQKGFFFYKQQLEILREQISSRVSAPSCGFELLTDREIMVLKLIAQQKTAKEIAELLFITSRTVEGHKNNMFAKTGTKNIAGLVIYAIQNAIIDPSKLIL
ncbi:response regulator transcription factor [Sphingobacterium multivorum]|nr:response regulator transcription factor [Sphingobacterium multivorum]QQT31826.1 response regulator transcription factor [Sphingobacterium multivorum]